MHTNDTSNAYKALAKDLDELHKQRFRFKMFHRSKFLPIPRDVLFHLNDSEVGVSIRFGEPAPVSLPYNPENSVRFTSS